MRNCTSFVSWKEIGIICFLVAGMTVMLDGQNVTTIVSFNNNAPPYGQGVYDTGPVALVQGRDGLLYGTTIHGGMFGAGTAFKTTTTGTLKTLHHFGSTSIDGAYPESGVTLAANGAFYGTTLLGGSFSEGTFFKLTSGGTLTILFKFPSDSAHGGQPDAAPLQASNGQFYAADGSGGANACGIIFKIAGTGVLTPLFQFPNVPFCGTGGKPGEMIQATDGNIYGTVWQGLNGTNNGSIFKMDLSGNVTDLYDFQASPDGANPVGLVEGSDGNFYGTTEYGGANNAGMIFRMTPNGGITKLGDFGTPANRGNHPRAPLIQATDGNFYGTTQGGGNQCGTSGCGTIFQLTPAGVLSTIYEFNYANNNNTGPWSPLGPLTQDTDGTFFGVTAAGGTNTSCNLGCGTIYHMTVAGIGPFVALDPTAANVGKAVAILGQGFVGTTSVKFNGVAATFTVKKNTYIAATVPVGASTGFVTVTTPRGTLKSNVPFQVLP